MAEALNALMDIKQKSILIYPIRLLPYSMEPLMSGLKSPFHRVPIPHVDTFARQDYDPTHDSSVNHDGEVFR
jgi:hypothetical protein